MPFDQLDLPKKLRVLLTCEYAKAKNWMIVNIWLQIITFGLGLSGFIWNWDTGKSGLALIVVGAITLVVGWRAKHTYQNAEQLKRHQEFVDGFGSPISPALVTDHLSKISKEALEHISAELIQGTEFASTEKPGVQRLLTNTAESAWFSKNLARASGCLMVLPVLCGLVVSFCLLYSAIAFVHDLTDTKTAADSLTFLSGLLPVAGSVVLFLLTGGMIRIGLEYFEFSVAASDVEEACRNLASRKQITEAEAIPIVAEYQAQRAAAPAIPTFIWRMKCKRLNELWSARSKPAP